MQNIHRSNPQELVLIRAFQLNHNALINTVKRAAGFLADHLNAVAPYISAERS
jgi:hypothetical protein